MRSPWLVDAIAWVQPWWAQEMDPGTYPCIVGHDGTPDRRPLVGPATTAGHHDDHHDGVRTMWELEDAWTDDPAGVHEPAAFVLHVLRLRRPSPTLPDTLVEDADADRLLGLRRAYAGRWYLSIDADFWTVVNADRVRVLQLFGRPVLRAMERYAEMLYRRPRGPSDRRRRRALRRWLLRDARYGDWGRHRMGMLPLDDVARNIRVVHHRSTLAEMIAITDCVVGRLLPPADTNGDHGARPLAPVVLSNSRPGGFLPSEEGDCVRTLVRRSLRHLWTPEPRRLSHTPCGTYTYSGEGVTP